MNEPTPDCPEPLRLALLELLTHSLLAIRANCTDPRLVFVYADHAHNLPALLAHFKLELLEFYWNTERPSFLYALPPGESVPQAFQQAWATIERVRLRVVD